MGHLSVRFMLSFASFLSSLPRMKSLEHCEAGGVTFSPPFLLSIQLQFNLSFIFFVEEVAKFQGCHEVHKLLQLRKLFSETPIALLTVTV